MITGLNKGNTFWIQKNNDLNLLIYCCKSWLTRLLKVVFSITVVSFPSQQLKRFKFIQVKEATIRLLVSTVGITFSSFLLIFDIGYFAQQNCINRWTAFRIVTECPKYGFNKLLKKLYKRSKITWTGYYESTMLSSTFFKLFLLFLGPSLWMSNINWKQGVQVQMTLPFSQFRFLYANYSNSHSWLQNMSSSTNIKKVKSARQSRFKKNPMLECSFLFKTKQSKKKDFTKYFFKLQSSWPKIKQGGLGRNLARIVHILIPQCSQHAPISRTAWELYQFQSNFVMKKYGPVKICHAKPIF